MIEARTTPCVKGNRLAKATRRVDAETVIGTYRYLGNTWRASKAVTNCGPEAVAPPFTRRGPQSGLDRFAIGKRRLRRRVKGNDSGGNTTVNFYYSQKWQILEMRNGSNQATRQFVYGTQYVDEPLLMDVNQDPGTDNICDPDTDSGDRRYAYAQDRNWNVVALLETDDGVGTAGAAAERYTYTPYGEFVVLRGEGATGTLGNALVASTVGNPFANQGLPFDPDHGSYQNRNRERVAALFRQRDPLGYVEGPNPYWVLRANSESGLDPLGLGTGATLYSCTVWCPNTGAFAYCSGACTCTDPGSSFLTLELLMTAYMPGGCIGSCLGGCCRPSMQPTYMQAGLQIALRALLGPTVTCWCS